MTEARALEASLLRAVIEQAERSGVGSGSLGALRGALERASAHGRVTDRVRAAITLAARGHAAQTTIDGAPYVLHPLHLTCQVAHLTESHMIVAALHDYFEDCDVDEDAVAFLTPVERDALERLTHHDGAEYLGAYLERIIESPLARDSAATGRRSRVACSTHR